MSKVERVREIIAEQQALEAELAELVGEIPKPEKRKYTKRASDKTNGAAPEEATHSTTPA